LIDYAATDALFPSFLTTIRRRILTPRRKQPGISQDVHLNAAQRCAHWGIAGMTIAVTGGID
jgi:hypothetical protein